MRIDGAKLESTMGAKYRNVDEERSGQIIAGSTAPVSSEVQEHGLAVYKRLALCFGDKILDVGSGDGDLVTKFLGSWGMRGKVKVNFVEPGDNFFRLRTHVMRRLGGSGYEVFHATAAKVVEALRNDIRCRFKFIVLNLALQYIPDRAKIIEALVNLLEPENANASVEITLTGPKHGQEFALIYNAVRAKIDPEGKITEEWDCGMVQDPEKFKETLEEAGYSCEISTVTDVVREDRKKIDPLLRRETVQAGWLYPEELIKEGKKEKFREALVQELEARYGGAETIQVLQFTIRLRPIDSISSPA